MFKQEEAYSKAIHGTTTVALKFANGVVLAADKRATTGYYVAHKKVRKIAKIDERAAMTISGLVADAQTLIDVVKAEISYYKLSSKKPVTIKTIASILSNIIFAYSRVLPYIVQLIVAGYDFQPRIYVLDWFGTLTEEDYTATGSGSPIAISVIESSFREKLDRNEAIKLAVTAVNAAMKRDTASGEGVDVVVITENGVEELSSEEILNIVGT